MTTHRLRASLNQLCPVCGAEPLHECTTILSQAELREYAAIRVLQAVRELREFDDKHPFVTIFEAAGGFRGAECIESGEKDVPAFLKNQAD